MITPEERLRELGIELPAAPSPLGAYVACVQTGDLLFLSGMLPLHDGKLLRTGKAGESISLAEAQEDARQAAINALSVLKTNIGSLNEIERCVKLNGYIASAPDFTDQPKVLNAASELMRDVFGEKGIHARAAVGVAVLPLNSPIEIDFIFQVKPSD